MKALVLFSGGLDSSTCLALAIEKYGKENVIALSISYGQKHSKEINAARAVAEYYGTELVSLDLAPIFEGSDCALLEGSDQAIPKGDYANQLVSSDGKPVSTYVPFRNGLFLSCAASVALSRGCGVIYYGVHSDDAAGSAYPDCSSDFNNHMSKAISRSLHKACGLGSHMSSPGAAMRETTSPAAAAAPVSTEQKPLPQTG